MTTNVFGGLALIEPIQRALAAADFHTPTPIQQQAIPLLLEGHDLLGCAQTGSGKTAAFGLPMLQHMARNPRPPQSRSTRALILAPTRELALQISESITDFARHMRVRVAVVFGGVNKKPQIAALTRGVDILVATPGRLLDLMGEGWVRLSDVEIMVLDEADRMLDMGFIPDVERIIARLPAKRQTLFFSATMPPDVARLARTMLARPAPGRDREDRRDHAEDRAEGALCRPRGQEDAGDRDPRRSRCLPRPRLYPHQAPGPGPRAVLVRAGLKADAIHGNKSQSQRQRALEAFHAGRIKVLVATDIAARGLDVDDIDHVINFELPNEPESYVHRIGRTARAGKEGIALSLCDATEAESLRDIERLLAAPLAVHDGHRFHSVAAAAARAALEHGRGGGGKQRRPAARLGQATACGRGDAAHRAHGDAGLRGSDPGGGAATELRGRLLDAVPRVGQAGPGTAPALTARRCRYLTIMTLRVSSRSGPTTLMK